MKALKQENLKNQQSKPRAEGLTNLPLSETQAEQTKGGRFDNGHGTHVAGTIAAVSN